MGPKKGSVVEEMNASLATYGYIALFLYSLGGGYVAIIAAGVLSYLGEMNIVVSILVASSANFLGDTLLFYLARNERKMMHTYLRKQRRKLALAHLQIKRFGDAIVVFQKYIYGVKTLIPLAVGLSKYDFKRFTLINIFASILWGMSVGLTAYYAGSVLVSFVEFIGENYFYMPVALLLILGGTYWYYSQATRKR